MVAGWYCVFSQICTGRQADAILGDIGNAFMKWNTDYWVVMCVLSQRLVCSKMMFPTLFRSAFACAIGTAISKRENCFRIFSSARLARLRGGAPRGKSVIGEGLTRNEKIREKYHVVLACGGRVEACAGYYLTRAQGEK